MCVYVPTCMYMGSTEKPVITEKYVITEKSLKSGQVYYRPKMMIFQ